MPSTTHISEIVWAWLVIAFNAVFPNDRVRLTAVLALISVWILCVVFAQLNRHTRKSHFAFWATAWLFYSLYELGAVMLPRWQEVSLAVLGLQAFIGISALCTVWGVLESSELVHNRRLFGISFVACFGWAYAVAYPIQHSIWRLRPGLLSLALAGGCAAAFLLKQRQQSRAATLVSIGFILWCGYLIASAFIISAQQVPVPELLIMKNAFLAVVALWIALGTIALGLDMARDRNETLLTEFKKAVAQRRLLEQEVNLSEQKYRVLFDSASDAIFLIDLANLKVVDANESAVRLTATERKSLITKPFAELCPGLPEARGALLENKRVVEEMLDSASEFSVRRQDGSHALCEGSANLVQYQKRPVLQINIREVTERKRMEQQLRQAEKLTALGRLVGGVAHELNNPLSVVSGYAQMLTQHGQLEERTKRDILKILHESDRAAKIVRNLLTFSRPSEPHMVGVDVNRLVSDALETREIQLSGANIRVVRRLASDLPQTQADPNQIEQVLANLVTNAVQALANCAGQRIIEAVGVLPAAPVCFDDVE